MTIPLLDRVTLVLDGWGARSQQVSRRNAMVALTALTQRRAELIEVEELLASSGPAPVRNAVSAAHG